MLALALRNLLRQKTRTAVTALAIAAGVMALILTGGFVQDVFTQLGEAFIHSRTGHLQIYRQGFYEAGSRSPEKYLIENPEALRHAMRSRGEIADVLARIQFGGLLNNGRADWPVFGEGVEPDKEARLGTYLQIIQGRGLKNSDAFGILLGEGVAQSLKLKPGDHVTLVANAAEGALNSLDFEIVGVFRSFSRDFDARAIRIALPAAQELLYTNKVNALVVSLQQTGDTLTVAHWLRQQFAPAGFEVKTWTELNDFYEKTVKLYDQQFGVLRLIILVMVLLSVTNNINMSVYERLGEFGTMMALGNRRAFIFRMVMLESLLLGLASALLGVFLGTAAAWAISRVGIPMPPPPNANQGYLGHIAIVPAVLLSAYVVGLVATVLGAVLPAARVSKTPVLEALRANI